MTTQENIQELFTKHGSIVNFKWINKEGNKMALLEMSSIEESVLSALIAQFNSRHDPSVFLTSNSPYSFKNISLLAD